MTVATDPVATNQTSVAYGVHSEVGKLRKVMVVHRVWPILV
ncbi:hypothetical protein OXH18_04475 [Thermocoleostomius sinensis A174]|uniref:Uncharacterized protein n=1 Tax=Thermocoleostomius sinensis A174 TaxID=2016057 RepID=A0A9E8ZHF5_9CYAN|nr:hypothetical protein OXH18_04475 [Thermocoleostomius sinensis A174]